jgi:hypothetical protein
LAAVTAERLRSSTTYFPAAFLLTAGPLGDAEVTAVVLAEGVLLAFADVRVSVDVRGVLHLVLGHLLTPRQQGAMTPTKLHIQETPLPETLS